MVIESLDIVFYTAIFVLPGFLMKCIIDATNPPRRHNDSVFFLKCLVFSIVNLSCFSWMYNLIFEKLYGKVFWFWFSLVVGAIITSCALALLLSYIKQKNIIKWFLDKLDIKCTHPIPTAWDYIFSMQRPNFVIVTLIDNTKVKGWYSGQSFASSDLEEHDIYIEKLFYSDEKNEWIEDSESDGIYISKDQIKYIEFKKGETSDE